MKALKFFLELAKYGPKSTPMNNTAQVRDGLLAGTVGIAPEVWPAWLGKIDDPNESKVAGKVKITKHPEEVKKSSPMIGIWHIAIPAASRNKDAAFDFLTFLTSRETQKLMVLKAGLPPSRVSVFEDKEILAKYPWYPPSAMPWRMAWRGPGPYTGRKSRTRWRIDPGSAHRPKNGGAGSQ